MVLPVEAGLCGTIQNKILPILKRQDVEKAGIFGSWARGNAKTSSDVDFVVELNQDKTLLDLIDLKLDLEKTLNKKVDVLTYNSLYPLLKDKILEIL